MRISSGIVMGCLIALAFSTDARAGAKVTFGTQTATATEMGGCSETLPINGQPGTRTCGDVPFPPPRFSEARAESSTAILRTDTPLALTTVEIKSRVIGQSAPLAILTPVQRDALTWELTMPAVTVPAFLSFGGSWQTADTRGTQSYVVGLLPPRPSSAVKAANARWTDRTVKVTGTAHADSGQVTLRFACRGTSTTKHAQVRSGKWTVALRTPARCNKSTSGRIVATVKTNDKVLGASDAKRIKHVHRPRKR